MVPFCSSFLLPKVSYLILKIKAFVKLSNISFLLRKCSIPETEFLKREKSDSIIKLGPLENVDCIYFWLATLKSWLFYEKEKGNCQNVQINCFSIKKSSISEMNFLKSEKIKAMKKWTPQKFLVRYFLDLLLLKVKNSMFKKKVFIKIMKFYLFVKQISISQTEILKRE